jgi:hypothetical protein
MMANEHQTAQIKEVHRDYQSLFRLVLAIAIAIAGYLIQSTLSRIDDHLDKLDAATATHGEDLAATRAILEAQFGAYRKALPKGK